MTEMHWNMLIGEFAFNKRVAKNRVGRRDCSSNKKGLKLRERVEYNLKYQFK
jgi:hypothetical protein